jgi:hypothetical protein
MRSIRAFKAGMFLGVAATVTAMTVLLSGVVERSA